MFIVTFELTGRSQLRTVFMSITYCNCLVWYFTGRL